MDELNSLDRVQSVDSAFGKQARKPRTEGTFRDQELGRDLESPNRKSKNMAAAVDTKTGLPWWKRGPAYERSKKS